MTRIVAGRWGGRRLATPAGAGTRPTSDRVREAMFASIQSELGPLDGLRVLDLFAGSGALGLEALSRGAASVDLVEADAKAAAVIRRNIADLGAGGATVHRVKAERFVAGTEGAYDLVLLDPPYAVPTHAVAALVADVPLAIDGLIVVERATRDPFVWPKTRSGLRERSYGETALWYGR